MTRTICITLLAVLLGMGLAAGADKSAGRPNVLLIYTDDHAQWAVGAYGNKEVHTPNMDRLAAEGILFTQGFTKPVCSPSRAMVLTGQYSHRLGIPDYISYNIPEQRESGLLPGTPTIASLLKGAGYATGLVGKWHLGYGEKFYPNRFGFDVAEGYRYVAPGKEIAGLGQVPNLVDGKVDEHFGKSAHVESDCTTILADRTIHFIRSNREKPFFLYLPFYRPHLAWGAVPEQDYAHYKDRPMTVPDPPADSSVTREKLEEWTRLYYANITCVDRNMGRVFETLDELGLAENTIVIFIGDNGFMVGQHGALGKGNARVLHVDERGRFSRDRGTRANMFDDSVLVPFIVRWPSVVKPGTTSDALVSTIDVLPTLAEAAGVEGAPGVDGRSLMPLLKGGADVAWRDAYFDTYDMINLGNDGEQPHMRMIRTDDWKLVLYEDENGRPLDAGARHELFNLKNDPGELTNLYGKPPAKVIQHRLEMRLRDWMRDSGVRSEEPAKGTTTALGTEPVQVWVAPDGDDRNPGTTEKPLATLAGARDAVRGVLGEHEGRDVEVVFRAGAYRISETVVFGLADSAGPERSVVYRAAEGADVLLSAGQPVPDWQRPEQAPTGLPERAHGHVWVADYPAGVDRPLTLCDAEGTLPRACSEGFRLGPTPEQRHDRLRDGRSLNWCTVEQRRFCVPPPMAALLKASGNVDIVELSVIPRCPWAHNVLPLASFDAATSIGTTTVPATYSIEPPRVGYTPYTETGAWLENCLAVLDQPGEWVADHHARKLYLWPRTERPADVVAAALNEMIRIEGRIDYDGPADTPVEGIVFDGITFAHGDRWTWDAEHPGWGLQHDWELFDRPTALIRLRGAQRCGIQSCRVAHSGGTGIRADLHCRQIAIEDNVVHDLGGVGVLFAGYGPGTKDVNRENTIRGNHIHHIGRTMWPSPAVFLWQSGRNQVVNNLIHDVPYTGIVVSGRIAWTEPCAAECCRTIRWKEIPADLHPAKLDGTLPDWYRREPYLHGRKNVIARNEIHHVLTHLSDGNAIYVSGTGAGNILRENYCHDILHKANGVLRSDDDQYEITIERNVVRHVNGEGILFKGKNTIIRNNIVYDVFDLKRGYLIMTRDPIDLRRLLHVDGSTIRRNIFVHLGEGNSVFSPQSDDPDTAAPILAIDRQGNSVFSPQGDDLREALQKCGVVDDNVYFHPGDAHWVDDYLATARPLGKEGRSLCADPGFISPETGDFRLRPDSPALKLGFEPIDMSVIGLNPVSKTHPFN